MLLIAGWIDLDLAARALGKLRVESKSPANLPSIDPLAEPREPRWSVNRLERLACIFLGPVSASATTPGPMDLRGCLAVMPPETGG